MIEKDLHELKALEHYMPSAKTIRKGGQDPEHGRRNVQVSRSLSSR